MPEAREVTVMARSDKKDGSAVMRTVVPHQLDWRGEMGVFASYSLLRILTRTLRIRVQDPFGFLQEGVVDSPVIFALWHNRLALSVEGFRRFVWQRSPDAKLAAMVSASRDGAFLARLLERFGVQPVRGSSSRRGRQALLEMTGWVERGYSAAITPDGPRGPRYRVQEGVVALAQVTGRPVVPIEIRIRWKKTLRSWDLFQVPLPFSVCDIVVQDRVWVERTATDEDRSRACALIESRLGNPERRDGLVGEATGPSKA